jgi:hypothetical protein
MSKPLVVSRHAPETPSRRILARDEAERLRRDAAGATDGTLIMHADRLHAIADLLDSLAGHQRTSSARAAPPPSINHIENDLATLMTRSAERGRDT